jgi:GDP-L-fucose synthase
MTGVTTTRIYVAGHRGPVGAALLRRLAGAGGHEVIVAPREALDLRDAAAVRAFFERERPRHVILAAGTNGGIAANRTRPAEFIHDNLAIQTAVLDAARRVGVERLLAFGSLEPTSEAFAVAKLAGVKLAEAYDRQHRTQYLSVMPASVYGPADDFDLASAHVLAALIRRFTDAQASGADVTLWGTGTPRREFIYADDLAEACLFLLALPAAAFAALVDAPFALINVGVGEDLTVRDLARLVADVVGFRGRVTFDAARPDGAPRKLLDSGRLRALGWRPATPLREGIRRTCEWYNRRDLRAEAAWTR